MHFTELLEQPEILDCYRKVKRYFYLRESAYDVSSKCQLRCEGCYYFQGDKYTTQDVVSADVWRQFFVAERDRGITYAVLAGAEPSLGPHVLSACFESIAMGTIASNGLRKIDPGIRYRVHLSVWGDAEGDSILRPTAGGRQIPNILDTQLQNYRNDDRVVFVYTFNGANTDQVDSVVRLIESEGHKITFNVFSPPVDYPGPRLSEKQRERIRRKMLDMINRFPNTVLYSVYNALVHTDDKSLDEQFGCVYPRAASLRGKVPRGIGQTFRSYRTDLTHLVGNDCCVPDTDCSACRHYAAGSAIVTARMGLHTETADLFRAWLDYVDTYLSVWVLGYQRNRRLYNGNGDSLSIRSARTLLTRVE